MQTPPLSSPPKTVAYVEWGLSARAKGTRLLLADTHHQYVHTVLSVCHCHTDQCQSRLRSKQALICVQLVPQVLSSGGLDSKEAGVPGGPT